MDEAAVNSVADLRQLWKRTYDLRNMSFVVCGDEGRRRRTVPLADALLCRDRAVAGNRGTRRAGTAQAAGADGLGLRWGRWLVPSAVRPAVGAAVGAAVVTFTG